MLDWNLAMIKMERYQELLREAEQERLVRQALAGRQRRDNFQRHALSWLGQRLVAWGCSLQEHYGVSAETPILQPAHPCR